MLSRTSRWLKSSPHLASALAAMTTLRSSIRPPPPTLRSRRSSSQLRPQSLFRPSCSIWIPIPMVDNFLFLRTRSWLRARTSMRQRGYLARCYHQVFGRADRHGYEQGWWKERWTWRSSGEVLDWSWGEDWWFEGSYAKDDSGLGLW